MNYMTILKILMKWSLENKQYDIAYFIYSEFNIGIPCKFLVNIYPSDNIFNINAFVNRRININTRYIRDIYLKNLIILLKKSKYQILCNWNDKHGYKI